MYVQPVRKKVCHNTREVFDLYRAETDASVIAGLHDAGNALVRVIAWLRKLPEVFARPLSRYWQAILLC